MPKPEREALLALISVGLLRSSWNRSNLLGAFKASQNPTYTRGSFQVELLPEILDCKPFSMELRKRGALHSESTSFGLKLSPRLQGGFLSST
jgi:hypothetical protein